MITNELSELRERINRAKALNRASNITYHALGILHTGVSGLVSVTGISKFFSPQVLGVLAASVGIVGAAVTWSKKLNDGRRDAAKELVALEGLELDIQDALVDQTNHTYSSVVEMIKKKTLG